MSAVRSGTLTSLRKSNIDKVLSILTHSGGMTQIEIAQATNLSPATVSNIVRELSDENRVDTQSVSRNNRRATYVTLAQGNGMVVGVSIDRLDLDIVLGDSAGNVVAQQHLPLPFHHTPDVSVTRAVEVIGNMLEAADGDASDLRQMVVAIPAPIGADGRIAVPEVLPHWDAVDIADRIEKVFGIRPRVENDANMAAVAQVVTGDLLADADIVYVHADYEIGGAFFLNGDLYTGVDGLAGEFGHIQVDPRGEVCRCGRRGCLNTVVSADRLNDLLRASRGDMTLRDIVNAAVDGDAGCYTLIDDMAEAVAMAVEPVISSFAPRAVVLGGRFVRKGTPFVESFSRTLRKTSFPPFRNPSIIAGSCAEEAVAKGAMLRAASRLNVPAV